MPVTQAALSLLMYAVCSSWLSLTLSGCSEYALWAAVVAGTQTGLMQLDATLHGIFHTFMPRLYPYQATSAAQPVLACFQVINKNDTAQLPVLAPFSHPACSIHLICLDH